MGETRGAPKLRCRDFRSQILAWFSPRVFWSKTTPSPEGSQLGQMTEATITISESHARQLYGIRDQHLRQIRQALGVDLRVNGSQLTLRGEESSVAQATEILQQLTSLLEQGLSIDPGLLQRMLQAARFNQKMPQVTSIEVFQANKRIRPLTAGQARLIEAISRHDLTFAVGPAGTGKTYLAVAMAVSALKQEQVRKIVLVRPAVEAGERLGFLPGDLQAKINPYLRPLLDALREMMDFETIKRYTEQDIIEMIPLAYMRGRTLNGAFIILDEAQNTTVAQMKMFLTRMGNDSKIVISGDITQIDLPSTVRSGFGDAMRRLRSIPSVSVVQLHQTDVVRHPLVQAIVQAYDEENPHHDLSSSQEHSASDGADHDEYHREENHREENHREDDHREDDHREDDHREDDHRGDVGPDSQAAGDPGFHPPSPGVPDPAATSFDQTEVGDVAKNQQPAQRDPEQGPFRVE